MASGGGRRRQPKPRARAKKGKRTKYLSLSDLMVKSEVAATPTPPTPPADDEPDSPRSPCEVEAAEVKPEEDAGDDGRQQQQHVEPFPLHHVHEASTLFEALPAPSLSDILGPSPSASPDGAGSSGASGRQRLPGRAQEEDLARRALRGRERWVYCSSPAATATPTATTSSSSPCSSSAASTGASAAARSLLLKLDYEEILAAWADRGSLYIGAAAAGGGSPEMQLDAVQVLVEVEPSEQAVAAPSGSGRAERVRRYKEKRRRRLFAKRIRYEVRRVNAVKRPRFKGRFIKEHEESELRPT